VAIFSLKYHVAVFSCWFKVPGSVFKVKNWILEAISKMQITFKDKARADEKAESRLRRDEQCILRKSATP
jgi:hypothetical protein